MQQYIARRLLLFIPTLVGMSLVIFIVMRIVPGDPALMMLAGRSGEGGYYSEEDIAKVRSKLGTDKPLLVQYVDWLWRVLHLDFGTSFAADRPVWNELKERFPVTFQLGLGSLLVVVLFAIPIGVLSATRQDGFLDYICRGLAILGLAMPTFWIGLMTVLILSRWFRWFPPIGFVSLWEDPAKSLQQLLWPVLALGFHSLGLIIRMTRTQMLEVLREDYIRTAWAKGLREQVVVYRHALKNALIPVLTVFGIVTGVLLSGTVVIELIFNLPGVGRLLIDSIAVRDYPVIQSVILAIGLIYLFVNLTVDLVYGWIDPRIRFN